ncbi:hypothetical protein BMT54_03850 [Pasteurellaceae bacterium 15-036681]|nr:hypothetical protein BMT54_03850 [Pasteurellaceae bacterium 15-036681]
MSKSLSNQPLFKLTSLASLVLLCGTSSYASTVRSDINYQYFRDFAENKGVFSVGATNIDIKNKEGQSIGTMMAGIKMPDFSAAERVNAIATAIAPQYIVSVEHNSGYGSVEFGDRGHRADAHNFKYQIVDRNDYPDNNNAPKDYHTPRLHKLITEIVPAGTYTTDLKHDIYFDTNRFGPFVRLGAGAQHIRDKEGAQTALANSYTYLTGGAAQKLVQTNTGLADVSSSLYENHYGPMATYGMPGDSGSPIFVWDKQENRWVLFSVLSNYWGDNGERNRTMVIRPEYNHQKQQEDIGATIQNTIHDNVYLWKANGKTSSISDNSGNSYQVDLADLQSSGADSETAKPSLNHGKTFHIEGNRSTLILKDNINQGAGAIYINAGVAIKPESNQTWQGAGIVVEQNKRVDWQVKNPEGDRLSKLGKGYLHVNGVGENKGSISVGDGTVVLEQRADSQGHKQAFKELGIVSGRPTVTLMDNQQVDLNNIYFGYRGGRLNLNSHNYEARRIQNIDDGAKIVNNGSGATNLTLTGRKSFTESDIQWGKWAETGKDLYEYVNNHRRNRTDYFMLKGSPNGYYPLDQNSDGNWEFLSSDKRTAIQMLVNRRNQEVAHDTYNGYFGEDSQGYYNGQLNIRYSPTIKDSAVYNITGGLNLNGDFTVEGGNLLLSGRHTPHAYDYLKGQEVIDEKDWINRRFNATTLITNNDANLFIGRNVTQVNSNFISRNTSKQYLGFEQEKGTICHYSDFTGKTNCQAQAVISADTFAQLPTTQIRGNAIVANQSELHLGKANFYGVIQADPQAKINISRHGQWINTGDSKVGQLTLASGATITLNEAFQNGALPTRFNKLVIDGNLSGIGRFNYLANVAEQQGDHVTVNGVAQGAFLLALKNTGREPNAVSPLSLLTLKNTQQDQHKVTVALENGYVDLGTYRYILANQNNDFRLYSPLRDAETRPTITADSIQNALDEAQNTLNRYNQEMASVNQAFEARLAEKERAEQELNQVNTNVSNAQRKLDEDTAYVNSRWFWTRYRKSEYLLSAQQALEVAQQQLTGATSNFDVANNAFHLAQTALQQARDKVANATATRDDLSKQRQLIDNLRTASEIENALTQAQYDLANVNQQLTALTQSFEQKQQMQQQANQAHASSVAALAEAQRQFDEQNAYAQKRWIWTKARKASYVAPYQAALDNAKQQADQARSTAEQANNDFSQVESALNQAKAQAANLTNQVSDLSYQLVLASPQDKKRYAEMLCLKEYSAELCRDAIEISASRELVNDFFYKSELADQLERSVNEAQQTYHSAEQALVNAKQTGDQAAIEQARAALNIAQATLMELRTIAQNARNDETNALLKIKDFVSNEELNAILAEMFENENSSAVTAATAVTKNNKIEQLVKQRDGISVYANSALSELSAQANALLQIGRNLDRQLLAHKTTDWEVWANSEYQQSQHQSDYFRQFKQNTNLTQIGVEKALNSNFRLGFSLANSRSDNEFSDKATAKNNLVMASLYLKGQTEQGWFATLDASFANAKTTLNVEGKQAKFKRNLTAFGLNLGKDWDLNGVEIQPSMGAKYYRLAGVQYQLDQAQIEIQSINFVAYNAGLKLAKNLQVGTAIITPSFSSYYVDASHKQLKLSSNGRELNQQFGRYFNHEFALAAQFSHFNTRLSLGLMDGNQITKQKYASLKLGYNW